MMLSGGFGAASDTIIVEECICGTELSAFALIDSEEVIWLASAGTIKGHLMEMKDPIQVEWAQ